MVAITSYLHMYSWVFLALEAPAVTVTNCSTSSSTRRNLIEATRRLSAHSVTCPGSRSYTELFQSHGGLTPSLRIASLLYCCRSVGHLWVKSTSILGYLGMNETAGDKTKLCKAPLRTRKRSGSCLAFNRSF